MEKKYGRTVYSKKSGSWTDLSTWITDDKKRNDLLELISKLKKQYHDSWFYDKVCWLREFNTGTKVIVNCAGIHAVNGQPAISVIKSTRGVILDIRGEICMESECPCCKEKQDDKTYVIKKHTFSSSGTIYKSGLSKSEAEQMCDELNSLNSLPSTFYSVYNKPRSHE